jgi:MATE family multidrug resistance protein
MFDTEIRTDGPGERAQSVARGGRPAWTVEARALLVLAAPLVASQLAQMGLLTTDVVMLGRLDAHALAAAAIGNTVYYFAWLLGLGPASAVAPMVAHILGDWAGDRAGVRSVARMGLWTAMLGSLPLMLILLAARPILVHLGQDPSLAADAGRFVAMLCIGLPFSLGFQVLRNLCTALGRPGATLWVTAASVAWNALADYALIFGHFGLPRLGIVGAGLATSSSSIFAFTALFLLIQAIPHLRAYRLLRRAHRPHWPRLSELLRLGAPIGATMIFENMLFNSMTLLVGAFGVDAVAAHQVALNICSLTFMVPLGIGMAAAVRVGRHAGGGDLDQARRAGFIAMALGAVFMTVSGLAMLAFGRAIVGLYVAGHTAAELQVIALAVTFLHIAAAFQVFDGLQVVGAFNLRGLKDARAPMVLAAASYWLVGAPVCVWLGVGLGWKGVGVWIGLVAGLAAAALSLGLRFHLLTRRAGRRSAGRRSAGQG